MALNLGSITFGLSADTTGLSGATSQLQDFGSKVSAAMKAARGDIDSTMQALIAQEGAAVRALQNVQNMTAKINSLKISPEAKTDAITQLEAAYTSFVALVAKSSKNMNPIDPLAFQRANLGFKEQTDQIQRSLNEEARIANTASDQVAAAMQKQAVAAERAAVQVALLQDAIARQQRQGNIGSTQSVGLSNRAQVTLGNFQSTMAGTALDPTAMAKAQAGLRASLTGIQRDLGETTKAMNPLMVAFRGFGTAAELTTGPLNGFVFRLRAATALIQEHGIAVGIAVTALAGFAVGAVGASETIIRTTIAYQQAQVVLQGVTQSSTIAAGEMGYLRDVAAQAGLQFTAIAPAFAKFIANATGAGQSVSVSNVEFKQFAMLAGQFHLSTDQVNNTLRAFDQIMSMGTVNGKEMRQLFSNLPDAFQAAGDAAMKMGGTIQDALQQKKGGGLAGGEFLQNFLTSLLKIQNVDVSKPIDTLQASLNRVNGAWQAFVLQLGEAIGASTAFKGIFADLQGALVYMTDHIVTIIGVVGALVGGLATFITIMGTVSLVTTIWSSILLPLVGFIRDFMIATEATETAVGILTAAQYGLNFAMEANPIGLVITLILSLGAALFGAKFAMDAMHDAAAKNTAAFDGGGDAIDEYIARQQKLGVNISDVTERMIKQQAVLLSNQSQSVSQGASNLTDLNKKYQTAQMLADASANNGLQGGGDDGGLAAAMLAKQASDLQNKVGQASIDLRKATADLQENQKRLDGLKNLMSLKDATTVAAGRGDQTKASSTSLAFFRNLVEAAGNAQKALQNMWQGPQNEEAVKAYTTAGEKIKELQASGANAGKEMTALQGIMNKAFAGSSITGLKDQIADLILKEKIAEDTAKQFLSVWGDAHKAQEDIKGINQEMQFLINGGNPDDTWYLKAVTKAHEELAKLTSGTQDLSSTLDQLGASQATKDDLLKWADTNHATALAAVVKMLDQMNVTFTHTGDSAKDAENGLAALFSGVDKGKLQVTEFEDVLKNLNTQFLTLAQQRTSLSMIAGGNLQGSSDYTAYYTKAQDALRKFYEQVGTSGPQVNTLSADLAKQGFTVGDLTQRYAGFLFQLDKNAQAITDWQGLLKTQEKDWEDWGTSALDSIDKVAEGAASLGDGLKEIFKNLAHTILQATLFDPLKVSITSMIKNAFSGSGNSNNPADVQSQSGGLFGSLMRFTSGNTFGSTPGIGGSGKGDNTASNAIGSALTSLNDLAGAGNKASNVLGDSLTGATSRSVTQTLLDALSKGHSVSASELATAGMIDLTAAATSAAAALTLVAASSAASGASSTFESIGSTLMMAATGGQLLKHFAGGGPNGTVSGPGSGTSDSIMAMISNGEFIVNAHQTQKHLALLHAINSGALDTVSHSLNMGNNLGHYADGGVTGGGTSWSGGNSSVTTHTLVDASTTIVVQGNIDNDQSKKELSQALTAHSAMMRQEIPMMVDQRVRESLWRGRYGGKG